MSEPSIRCPSCKTEIKLTESLAAPLLEATRKECDEKLHFGEEAIKQREAALKNHQAEFARAKESFEAQMQERLDAERKTIAAEEAKKAKQFLSLDLEKRDHELAELQDLLNEREAKLADAQEAQAQLIIKERELDDARREMNLTIQRQIQEASENIRLQARKEATENFQLKVMEKEKTIADMKLQIEELKQKAEQGSEQLQGEVLELHLEGMLKARFPHDTIEPVPKGEFGGDTLQRVFTPSGQRCGTILWEYKRAKNWNDGWLTKLRNDQHAAKAECAIIVSQVLPRNVEHFDLIDHIWVTSMRTALPVAMAIRQLLIELSSSRLAREGQQTKMEMVYYYLTGSNFRQRVQAIIEKFTLMQEEMQKERKYLMQRWAARDQLIQGAIDATMGMYGDLEGIAGQTLQQIEGLSEKLLERSA